MNQFAHWEKTDAIKWCYLTHYRMTNLDWSKLKQIADDILKCI